MLQEAIVNSKERMGISRTVIKNYIESNYKMEITPSVVSNISRALKTGEDKNIFVFPKGMYCAASVFPSQPVLIDVLLLS
jgi:histone H1/5